MEFAIVAPTVTLIGMGALQYALMFNAKNHLNHAAFMAARAGATNHALLVDSNAPDTASIRGAYVHALAPLYGGGNTPAEVANSEQAAKTDLADNLQIEIINPMEESFADWGDAALSATLGRGRGPNGSNALVIRNTGQEHADNRVGATSKQTLQEANLLKIRVTHGYEPSVPVIRKLLVFYYTHVQPQDGLTDFEKSLLAKERIPVVTQATVQMQSHAILQEAMVSIKDPPAGGNGSGGGGGGSDGSCRTLSCEATGDPVDDSNGDADAGCVTEDQNYEATDAEIVYFAFDSDELTEEAKADLDEFVEDYQDRVFDSVEVYGFTDRRGDESYNLALSERRAKAVKQYLESKQFTSKPIHVIAKGETSPKEACPGDDADLAVQKCLAGNRRVVISLKNVVIGQSASQPEDAASDASADATPATDTTP